MNSIVKSGLIAAGSGAAVATLARTVLPSEQEEAEHFDNTKKNILSGWEVERGLGVSAAVSAVAAGATAIGMTKLHIAGPTKAFTTAAVIAGSALAGITTSHLAVKPIESIGRQIGPTWDYLVGNDA